MAEPTLGEQQAWLQARILAAHYRGAEAMIAGSPTLSAERRLAIYANGYSARLRECLSEEFAVLRALCGDDVFELFASAYIASRPMRSFTLYDLGAGFADFLDRTRPDGTAQDGAEAIPAQLARLERAMSECQRAQGPEQTHATLAPALTLLSPMLRLKRPRTVRLLRLDFDFLPTLEAARAGRRPDRPEPGAQRLAVARAAYRVRVHGLNALRFAFLEALAEPQCFADAADHAATKSGEERASAWAELNRWLLFAREAGLIVSLGS